MEASGSPGYASHHAGASISVTAVLHGGLWQSWPCFTPCWGLYSSHSYILHSTDTPMAVVACAAQCWDSVASCSAGYVSHYTGASIAVTAMLHGSLWQCWLCFTPHWDLYSSHSYASWRPLALTQLYFTVQTGL